MHLEVGGQPVERELESNLVVPLPRASVAHRICVFRACDADDLPGDQAAVGESGWVRSAGRLISVSLNAALS